MKPRPYQDQAIGRICDEFAANGSTLAVLATGLGKTVIFAHVIKRIHALTGKRCMVVAHRAELIHQAAAKIATVTGIKPDIEMGDLKADFGGFWKSPIVVTSIQTQVAGTDEFRRMHKFKPHEFALLVIDEAHHAVADSYRSHVAWMQTNPELRLLGVTATPDRTDEEALGQVFKSVAFEYDVADGVRDGWLVPIRQRFVTVQGLDFSGVRTTAGDLNGADLANVMESESKLHGVVNPLIELARDKKTLVFATSVNHATRMTEIFNRHQEGSARIVTGTTPADERRQLLRDYSDRKFQFLVNVGVATEGFDDPGIEIIAMARPTKSRPLYAQMLGRGTRPLPGIVDAHESVEDRRKAIAASAKPHMLVLDFSGNAGMHKLVHAADILGGVYNDRVTGRAVADHEKAEDEHDVIDALEKAEKRVADDQLKERRAREAAERAEAERRKHVLAKVEYTTEEISPFDVMGITPRREAPWHRGRAATPKQVALLEKHGVLIPADLSLAHAGQLIDKLFERKKNGRCTVAQAKTLAKHGYSTDCTVGEASKIIASIRAGEAAAAPTGIISWGGDAPTATEVIKW